MKLLAEYTPYTNIMVIRSREISSQVLQVSNSHNSISYINSSRGLEINKLFPCIVNSHNIFQRYKKQDDLRTYNQHSCRVCNHLLRTPTIQFPLGTSIDTNPIGQQFQSQSFHACLATNTIIWNSFALWVLQTTFPPRSRLARERRDDIDWSRAPHTQN